MDFRPRRGECGETSGFLFPHPCGNFPVAVCSECGKEICQRHRAQESERELCTSCAKKLAERERDEPRRDRESRSHYDDDPYFYSYHHYPNYWWLGVAYHHHRHDPHDFTDGDEALVGGGEATPDDVTGFEDDMGGS